MASPDWVNPLTNPIFIPYLIRTTILFAVGFIVIAVSIRFRFSAFFSSKLGKIYLGWLVLTPLYILGIFLGRIPGLVIMNLFAWTAIYEATRLSELPGRYRYSLFALSFVTLMTASYIPSYLYMLPLVAFMILSTAGIFRNDAKNGLHHVSLSLFIYLWIIFGLAHFILLSNLNNQLDSTRSLLLIVITAVSLSDIGAYIFGKLFHKLNFFDQYKIASNISPNKTYIGVIGHIVGAAAGIGIMYFAAAHYLSFWQWLLVAIYIGVFGLLGGLTNSMFKRFFNSKDSSHLIPGLGGVLDRIDSMVRVIIVVYYFLLSTLS